tara:strand:- start:2748 stop:4367 length:1620 start_codon:yes stop_codon:yes gene_type:complete
MIPDLFLKSLQIRNIATFENQTVQFSSKFNAIVGETGSGKSLILDSLQLIFGGRADKKIVRKSSDFAMVEAIFRAGSQEVIDWLTELGHPSENNEIVVKRLVYPAGPSKAWLNFQSCPISLLTQFSRRYIDLVGQFENQKLLSPTYLLKLLDQYANIDHQSKEFSKNYSGWSKVKKELELKKSELAGAIQQEDYIKFQLNEIESLNPSKEDEAELLKKKHVSLNQEKHQKILSQAQSRLSGDEDYSILNQLNHLIKTLDSFPLIDSSASESLNSALELLSEVDYKLGSIELDALGEDELESVVERLDQYQKLKRKFGGDIEVVMANYEELKISHSSLNSLQAQIAQLEKASNAALELATGLALKLHEIRSSKAKLLSSDLTKAVRKLNMSGATIKLNTIKSSLSSTGMTELSFEAETNIGEGYYSIQDIASGGELSRILLSLRQVLSSRDSISVFLFDEIDAGIGGETALKIGKSLLSVSQHSQVIAITHLPQIAVHADQLVHVSKMTVGEGKQRTLSTIDAIPTESHQHFIQSMTPLN